VLAAERRRVIGYRVQITFGSQSQGHLAAGRATLSVGNISFNRSLVTDSLGPLSEAGALAREHVHLHRQNPLDLSHGCIGVREEREENIFHGMEIGH
jgi:hypothetical protein